MALGPIDRPAPQAGLLSSEQLGPRIPTDEVSNDEHQFRVDNRHGPVTGETNTLGV